MHLDGLWTAEFASNEGLFGGGIVLLQDGIISGGDSGYVFSGRVAYSDEQQKQIHATVEVEPFLENQRSIFNTLGKKITLHIIGRVSNDNQIVGHGSPEQLPGARVTFKLSRRVVSDQR